MELYNPEYATYLPAVNASYLNILKRKLPPGRRFPAGITPQDLLFWEDNALWHYPYLLHSIGQYKVGTRPNPMLDRAQRKKSVLIGDSGGYQIGKGTLAGLSFIKKGVMPADDAVAAWRKERVAREWIRDWLTQQCDYSMTIDMPLWATGSSGVNSPFHRCSSQQLIAMTVQNLRVLQEFSPPESRWLNVIQGGASYTDSIEWFRAVDWFRRGGWALAGSAGVAGGLVNFLMTVLIMRDAGAFKPGQDWLHVLGVSTPLWAVALTSVQQELRKINPAITVSYDSSSPFLLGGRFEQVCLRPELTQDVSTWTIRSVDAPQKPSYADPRSTDAFPYDHSPIGKRLKLNELNVRGGTWDERPYDSLSNALLINHNIWTHLDAFKRANDCFAAATRSAVPREYAQCMEVIRGLFDYDDAVSASFELEKHLLLLDRLAPMTL